MILHRAKKYYENDKERLKNQERDKYRNLFEEKKIKKKNMQEVDTIIYHNKRDKN